MGPATSLYKYREKTFVTKLIFGLLTLANVVAGLPFSPSTTLVAYKQLW